MKRWSQVLWKYGVAARSGTPYEDYYQHRPVLSQTKLKNYAKEFALEFNKNN